MNIREAILIAQKEDKKIALPTNDECEKNGFHILAKPFNSNLVLMEFYGIKRNDSQFALAPKELIRDDWIVVD